MVQLIPDVLAPEIKSPAESGCLSNSGIIERIKNMLFFTHWELQSIPIISSVRLIL